LIVALGTVRGLCGRQDVLLPKGPTAKLIERADKILQLNDIDQLYQALGKLFQQSYKHLFSLMTVMNYGSPFPLLMLNK